jgi:dihydropyrimidinase
MPTVIRHGRIIAADQDYIADILIENETIRSIAPHMPARAGREIDATGKDVIPGGVDARTHLDMPFCGTVSSDDFETGARVLGDAVTVIARGRVVVEDGNWPGAPGWGRFIPRGVCAGPACLTRSALLQDNMVITT